MNCDVPGGVRFLTLLLSCAILAIWVQQRWAWDLAQAAIFVFAAAWAIRQLSSPSPVRLHLWLVPLAAAVLWGLVQLSTGRTVYRFATWDAVLIWAAWDALFFLALQLFVRSAARHWFLRFAIYFGFALCVVSTVQMFTSGGKIFWRFPSGYTDFVMGPFVNRNHYAAFMEMILPVALWQALRDEKRAFVHYAMAAAMVASVVAAASRAGSVLVCLEILAVLLAAWARGMAPGRTLARTLAGFAVMAVLLIAGTGWQTLRKRLWDDPDPFAGRREMVESSLAMLHERPVMGFGLGNWARAYPQYALFDDGDYVNQAHNDWLQWAAEGGWPFLAIQFILAVMVVPAALRSVWGIGLLSVWVHCLVDYPMQQRPALAAWFFVLLGALAGWQQSHVGRRAGSVD